MTPENNHDLTLDEAIQHMEGELSTMRAHPNKPELEDIASDTAFELGYETAIHDLKRVTGPDPVETGIIIYTPGESHDDAD